MAIESIALIPSGYKATKVYSQLPVNGNGDFTFDRGTSTAQTRVNKDGLIESVAQDVPRLDYLDGGCPSLLLEPATTNLITYSEDFSNVAWSKTGAGVGTAPIVTSNFALSPDGSVNADRVQFNLNGGVASGDFSVLSDAVTVTSTATTTKSIYLKSNDGNSYNLNIYDGSVGDYTQIVVTNEWQRFEITDTVPSTSSSIVFGLRNISGVTTSDTADVLVWGAQLEEKSYATSYVRSLAGVSGVRNAETCNGAGTTAEINSQEGVLFFEGRAIGQGEDRQISITDNSVSDRVSFQYSSTTNLFAGYVISGGVIQETFTATLINSEIYSKFALKYSNGDCKLYINGLEVASGNTFTTMANTLSELEFHRGNGSSPFYGRVKKLSVYDSALSETELEELTGFSSFAEMKSYLSYS